MLEIVLTREDANTEYALLAEWLVEDRSEVSAGQPVCVVETTKATVEVEAPGAGTIVQLYGEEVEVELGKTIAYVAETADELASIAAPTTVVASRDEADPEHPYDVGTLYAETIPGARLVSEEPGRSPLAWQGGQLSKVIAGVAESAAPA